MEFGLCVLDSRGRLVIPRRVRERAGLSREKAVLVVGLEGIVILRKFEPRDLKAYNVVPRWRWRPGKPGGLPPVALPL
jgi:bifunctional DNA-binding transcriptional regulator/antitoxin component of YhaV-PrlF toxin-antitoxin module